MKPSEHMERHAQTEALADGVDGNALSYSLTACRGKGICPFGLVMIIPIKRIIETALDDSGWALHMKRLHPKGIQLHHRLRISLAACPNSCSQPQIHDIGLIAASRPRETTQACTGCGLCEKTCGETAIFLQDGRAVTRQEACLACGECAKICPVGAIRCDPLVFRLLLGGHMGRHPAWAFELHQFFAPGQISRIFHILLSMLLREARHNERPSMTFIRLGIEQIEHEIENCEHG